MDSFCENYRSGDELDQLYIAYAKSNYPIFIVIPIIAIIINTATIILYFKKIRRTERKQ